MDMNTKESEHDLSFGVRLRLVNSYRLRREYHAEIELDGKIVGYVERSQSSKMLGYRAGQYRAKLTGSNVIIAAGSTLGELRQELRDHFADDYPDAKESW